MRIAIVDSNKTYQNILEAKIESHNSKNGTKWEVDYFSGCKDLGMAKLRQYEIIISEYDLPVMKGHQLLESIQHKTNASMALMGLKNGWVSDKLIQDNNIKTIIDKRDPSNVISWVKYMESRLEIDTYYNEIQASYDTCAEHLSTLPTQK